jgi:hypothetical protein
MKADLRVDTVGKTVEDIVIEVLSRLDLHDEISK